MTKPEELLSKHLYNHGGDGLGITDGTVYMAVLDAIQEALTIPIDISSLLEQKIAIINMIEECLEKPISDEKEEIQINAQIKLLRYILGN